MKLNFRQILAGVGVAALLVGTAYAATQTLTLGASTGPGGVLTLFGSTSGSVTVQPAAVAGTATLFQLPPNNGTNNYVLQTDGNGVTSWGSGATAGAATVTGTAGQILCTPTSGNVVCSLVAANTLAMTFSAANTFTGAATFAEVHGGASAPSLTSNNYTAVQSDCGTLVKLPAGTTGATVTLPNLNVQCVIAFKTTAARAYLFNVASGGSKQNSQGFYTTRGTAAGDTVIVTIMTPSSSAALWDISGDVTT